MDITLQVEEILKDFTDEVKKVVEQTGKEVADQAVEELKNTSPDGKRTKKKYKNSWKVTTGEHERGVKYYTVYNEQGNLTHLLERGHMTRDHKKRTVAQPHIKPAEEKFTNLYRKTIIDKLGG